MVKDGQANPRFLTATSFAVEAHGRIRQERKGTTYPYVVHPIRVGEILWRHRAKEDTVVAGILHDVLEDTRVTEAQLRRRFGRRVTEIVKGVTEPDKSLSRAKRMEETIDRLRAETDPAVWMVAAADKLDNVRTIRDTIAERGEAKTWQLFNAPRPHQETYYRSMAEALVTNDPKQALFQQLALEVAELFAPAGDTDWPFLHATELRLPEQARPYLAEPRRQWRPGASAYELAHAWIRDVPGVPPRVAQVLASTPFEIRRIVHGFFEREVALGTPGRRSQTDLMLLVEGPDGYAVIAVEGKALETFGPKIDAWLESAPARSRKPERLAGLCRDLNLSQPPDGDLRYQLLHRAVSAVREARNYGVRRALLLVHAFDPAPASLEDLRAFADAIGVELEGVDCVYGPVKLGNVELSLVWVQDTPRSSVLSP